MVKLGNRSDPMIINPPPGVGVYKLGTTAPPNAETDPGACGDLAKVTNPAEGWGEHWDTDPILQDKYNQYLSYITSGFASGAIAAYTSPQAVAAMRHFLERSGSTVTLNVQEILSGSEAARSSWDASLAPLITLIEQMEFVGTIHLAETKATLGSTAGSDWSLAIGQFTGWAMADVTGAITPDGSISYSVTLHYNIWDPCDWDKSKGCLPEELAEMHMQDFAKQYLQEGTMEKGLSWIKGSAPETPAP